PLLYTLSLHDALPISVLAGASPRASTVIGSRTPPYQTLSSPSFPRLAGAGPASPLPAAPTEDTATCAVYPEPTVSSIPSNIAYAFMSNLPDGRLSRVPRTPASCPRLPLATSDL